MRCSFSWLLTRHCWVLVPTSARALTACSAVADPQVEQKPLCCYFPILTGFCVQLFLLHGFCGSVVSADGGLTEASVRESPSSTGETTHGSGTRESLPGQCVLLLELVMDKVSAVLKPSSPVSARDPTVSHSDDTVSPSCGLTTCECCHHQHPHTGTEI